MAPKVKGKGNQQTSNRRNVERKHPTNIFYFYLNNPVLSHETIMNQVDATLERILMAQSPKNSQGKSRFKRLYGKLYTPEGDDTFEIRICPDENSSEEESVKLLFRWVDLYYVGFSSLGRLFIFRDAYEKIRQLPPSKYKVVELPFVTAYSSLGGADVLVGTKEMNKLYRRLLTAHQLLDIEDGLDKLTECQMSLPAVIFAEALRFLKFRAWLLTVLASRGTLVPQYYAAAIHEWSDDSKPFFENNGRPHQKHIADLAILKRPSDIEIPLLEPVYKREDEEASKKRTELLHAMAKVNMNVVICGHLSSGKSTTIGHLISMKGIEKGVIVKYEESAPINTRYAWILDMLKAERERGMSIEVSIVKLESDKYIWTVIDTPGYWKFIKNMIAGTSMADFCVLIIDATEGAFEAGFANDGQTREHAILAKALGVKQIICCINKMDATTPKYSKERYDTIVEQVRSFLQNIGFDSGFVPISGLYGDNLTQRSVNMDWYKGLPLLDALDKMEEIEIPADKQIHKQPLRLPLQRMYDVGGVGTVVCGRVHTGKLKSEMTVSFEPSSLQGKVLSVELHNENVHTALSGDIVGVNIRGVALKDLKRGLVASNVRDKETISFVAIVKILSDGNPVRICSGYTPVMHCHTCQCPVRFTQLLQKLKLPSKVLEEDPKFLRNGEAGLVKMVPKRPTMVEAFKVCRPMGRFVIRDRGRTVGFGSVQSVERKAHPAM